VGRAALSGGARIATGALAMALALAACRGPSRTVPSDGGAEVPEPDRLAPLHAFEEARRRATDFARAPPSDQSFGADPIAIRALPRAGPQRYVGLLRGRDALVLLDASLHELARAPTPALPTGLSVDAEGAVAVSGEQGSAVFVYAAAGDALRLVERVPFEAVGLRDVALTARGGDRVVHALDERAGTLLTRRAGEATAHVVSACHGPFRLVLAGEDVLVDCLLDHRVLVFATDARGLPAPAPRAEIHHDGPMWGLDARASPDALLVAVGGVEDHPLDRTEGSFGFIDSFVFLYRVDRAGRATAVAAVNVSEQGVVTPRAIALRERPGGERVVVAAGYGSDRLAEISWPVDGRAPIVKIRALVPGAASIALAGDSLVIANPLLDAWCALGPMPDASPSVVAAVDAAHGPPRSVESRVGEALFFTNLMAPWNRSEGRLSRFTCEACHFEGYVDGRTHHTGRGDIRATTKPLLGLFNNRPHFSRALDPNLAVMTDNEFRAAGANSGHEPWFTAADAKLDWLPRLGAEAASLDALGLRRALMSFFMEFGHRPNPAALGRDHFTPVEARGAAAFATRCEGCHEARLVADEASTRTPADRWESLVLSREGPIVWAANVYRKTGVEPYVHELGARPPSLRRLYKKWPYFTNGSAPSLAAVVERARYRGGDFWHDAAPADAARIDPDDAAAIVAFLDLL
jgi:hypothetical protein